MKHCLPGISRAHVQFVACLMTVVVAVGCASTQRYAAPVQVSQAPLSSPQPAVPLAPPLATPLVASFDEFAATVGADVGLAFAPVGQPDAVTKLGSWSSGPAWSTSKVPLSIALLRETGTGEATSAMSSAITVSDNGAAESIWSALGGGSVAAAKVQAVLAAAGNPLTVVPSERRRAEFSIFGQTDWSLTDQARFLANIACDPSAAPVTALMGQISSGQRWGIGGIDGTYLKGGWGPGTDGLYLVRQFGVIPTPSGQVAVAVAAVSNSGSFGGGTAVLDQLAGWLQAHLGELGGGHCATQVVDPAPVAVP